MSMVGADVPALRAFVSAMTNRRRQIETTTNKLSALVNSLPWVGPDYERFKAEWDTVHHPNLIRLLSDMGTASSKCSKAADAQEAASNAGGGGGGGSW
jgi:hypothetical protein